MRVIISSRDNLCGPVWVEVEEVGGRLVGTGEDVEKVGTRFVGTGEGALKAGSDLFDVYPERHFRIEFAGRG